MFCLVMDCLWFLAFSLFLDISFYIHAYTIYIIYKINNVIFMVFFVDGSDVIAGISLYENIFTDSRYDITCVNFNS